MTRHVDAYVHEGTGREYPTWEALVEDNASGYVMVVVITSGDGKQTWPYVEGPFTKAEAERRRANLRSKWKRQQKTMPDWDHRKTQTYKFFVRPAWLR